MRMLPLILLPILLVASVALVQAKTPEQIYRDALPSVLTLLVEKKDGTHSQGSAFLAMDQGLAVTAWHVVEGAKRVVAKFATEEEFEVSGIVDKDEKRDLAIIRVKVYGRPLMQMVGDDPAVGSRAYVISSPRGLEYSISDGLVSQVRTSEGIKEYQFTCPASPGSSGGPLVNEMGQVIGVVASQIRKGQNLNFAVPTAYVLGLDRTLPTHPWMAVTSFRRRVGKEEMVEPPSTEGGEMVHVSDFGFYIDKYEVTNEQYADFLNTKGNQREGGATWLDDGSRHSQIENRESRFTPKLGYPDHPVIEVSWYGAKAYCEWAGKRLPTEGEWQQACQGRDGRKYPWGNSFDRPNANIGDSGDFYERTSPVGSFPRGTNPYGAMDMSGNVWEWTSSASGRRGDRRILRGGSWFSNPDYAQCGFRYHHKPSKRLDTSGFRCVW